MLVAAELSVSEGHTCEDMKTAKNNTRLQSSSFNLSN